MEGASEAPLETLDLEALEGLWQQAKRQAG
jgi:hypothetical protein